jgi:peptidoglycan/LPS O-acetylase OafA/YrhL
MAGLPCGAGLPRCPSVFMISGYCIAAAAVNHCEKQYRISRYFARRIQRIYPPYWICLCICLILSLVPGTDLTPTRLNASQWLGNIFLFEEYRSWLFPPEATAYLLAVSWTLCYEEQFYVLSGLILLVRPSALFSVFGAITAFVLLNNFNLNIWPLSVCGDLNRFKVNLHGLLFDEHWLFFAAGIWMYWYLGSTSRYRLLFPLAVLGLIVWELRQLDWHTNRFQTRVVTFGTTLLLSQVSRWDSRISALQITRPLFWISDRTFSIYLIHLPIVLLIVSTEQWIPFDSTELSILYTIPSSVVASIIAGQAFYCQVERRFMPSLRQPSLI